MGDAEQPLANASEAEEVTARTAVSPQLVAMSARAKMEPAMEDKESINVSSVEEHASPTDGLAPATTSGQRPSATSQPAAPHFGIAPLGGVMSGIAPLGQQSNPFGVAPLGAAAAMPPPEVSVPDPQAVAVESLHTPEPPTANEHAPDEIAPIASAKQEPPPDSGWGTLRPQPVEALKPAPAEPASAEPALVAAPESPEPAAVAASDPEPSAEPAAAALDESHHATDVADATDATDAMKVAESTAVTDLTTTVAHDHASDEAESHENKNETPAPEAPPVATLTLPSPSPTAIEADAAAEPPAGLPSDEAGIEPNPPPSSESLETTEAIAQGSDTAVCVPDDVPAGDDNSAVDEALDSEIDQGLADTSESPVVGRRPLRSNPPPKPAGYLSERPLVATVPHADEPLAATSAEAPTVVNSPFDAPEARVPVAGVPPTQVDVSTLGDRLRASKGLSWFWGASVAIAAVLGWAAAPSGEGKLKEAAASASAAVQAARVASITEAKAAMPAPPANLDLSLPSGVNPILEILKAEPNKRMRLEAVALGRHWQQKHFDDFNRLADDLRQRPQRLDESKVRTQLLEFVHDRATSRIVLEMLSELNSQRALDLLYEIWIGSKDRNETTQLAEALLLSKDVRPRVSGALDLALKLRDKPTDCGEIQTLVERAIREGDRRSAHQLVTTAARQNCGANGGEDCVKCLTDVKDMRKAIRASAARPDPVP